MEPISDDALRIVAHVADNTHRRYAAFADRDDIHQEVFIYYVDNEKKFEKWRMAGNREETFRLMRALFGAAKKYCETEKALKSGYSVDDVYWYEPVQLAALIPLAFNPRWDGLKGAEEELGMPRGKSPSSETGNLLAMVCDIRRALKGSKLTADHFDLLQPGGKENLDWLSQRLGGTYPTAPGYEPGRKAVSNEHAIAKTGENY